MKNKGFTLIELAVVLAIIAVLAAILTPMVTGYIDQARVSRATGEVRLIADAIRLYQRDVGEYPVFNTAATASSDTSAAAYLRSGTGSDTTGTSWTGTFGTTSLESFLNTNFQSKTIMTTTGVGKVSFRGPYIGNLDADPWGNKYVVTAANLEDDSVNWAYAISAGPNGVLDTNPNISHSATLTPAVDDLVAAIK